MRPFLAGARRTFFKWLTLDIYGLVVSFKRFVVLTGTGKKIMASKRNYVAPSVVMYANIN